ncbi:MAG TPA: acyltransferase [Ideonella sp.]|nr:acyltransferase [Ideonella sp.]
MLDQPLLLDPLLRLMPLPATLVRHAPLSAERRLRTLRLADTPLVAGLTASFDDSCQLTLAEDMEPDKLPLKLATPQGRRHYTGVHITVLSSKGQFNLLLGDDHCRLFVGSQTTIRGGIQLLRQSTAFIGDRTVIGQSRLIVGDADLVIGEDCHLVEDVLLQCNDPHPITDLSNGKLLNTGRQRMYLGRHVLVNRRALLMPGVRIGDGAIVQAGALVASDVPPNTWVGGSPARVLREQVGWTRESQPGAGRGRTRHVG